MTVLREERKEVLMTILLEGSVLAAEEKNASDPPQKWVYPGVNFPGHNSNKDILNCCKKKLKDGSLTN